MKKFISPFFSTSRICQLRHRYSAPCSHSITHDTSGLCVEPLMLAADFHPTAANSGPICGTTIRLLCVPDVQHNHSLIFCQRLLYLPCADSKPTSRLVRPVNKFVHVITTFCGQLRKAVSRGHLYYQTRLRTALSKCTIQFDLRLVRQITFKLGTTQRSILAVCVEEPVPHPQKRQSSKKKLCDRRNMAEARDRVKIHTQLHERNFNLCHSPWENNLHFA